MKPITKKDKKAIAGYKVIIDYIYLYYSGSGYTKISIAEFCNLKKDIVNDILLDFPNNILDEFESFELFKDFLLEVLEIKKIDINEAIYVYMTFNSFLDYFSFLIKQQRPKFENKDIKILTDDSLKYMFNNACKPSDSNAYYLALT